MPRVNGFEEGGCYMTKKVTKTSMMKTASTKRLTMKRLMGGTDRKDTSHGVTSAVKTSATPITLDQWP